MANIRIPRLVGKTNKTGLTIWYWQPSASLRKQGLAPERLGETSCQDLPEHIAAAARRLNEKVDGAPLDLTEIRQRHRPMTLKQAIRSWSTLGFPSVKQPGTLVSSATARQYRGKCGTLEAWGGDVSLSSITTQRVAKLRDALMVPAKEGRWADQVRHHAAHETLRVGRTLFSWLEQQGTVPKGSNPFDNFALSSPRPRQHIWWQPHRDAILAAAAEDCAAMELAIDLALSIGQREADLLRIQLNQYIEIPTFKMDREVWEQLAEATEAFDKRRCVTGIRIRQAKTGAWIEVPIVGETRRRVEVQVAAAKAAGVTVLLFDRDSGLPWTMPNLEAGQRRFIRRFAEIRATAIAEAKNAGELELAGELEQLQYRDFRRTAVVHQGELAIPSHLIAAMTGHDLDTTERILETYMPRTTGMAARAIALSQARAPAQLQEVAQ